MRNRNLLAIPLALACNHNLVAAEIEALRVSKSSGVVDTRSEFVIEAPYRAVFNAFTAFERLGELNPAVVASRVEELTPGRLRVSTRIRDCVALFCRTVDLVEDIALRNSDEVSATVVPELSDFESGHATWRFFDLGGKTRVIYVSRVKPKFWLPPLVGTRAIRKTLRRQISFTAANLETGAEQ